MVFRVADQPFERFYALFKSSSARVNVGSHNKEGELAVFSSDDLWSRRKVRLYVCRIQHPSIFLKLLVNYFYPEGVYVRFRHQLTFFH